MLCEKCKKNEATTHIKTNINGVVETHHLCGHCAAEQGYSNNMFAFGIGDLLGSFLGGSAPVSQSVRCPVCGASFDEIAASGKVGCDKCYEVFLDRLVPSLERMHGRSKHVGKRPQTLNAQPTVAERINCLRGQLNDAVAAQEFERAAQLRDQIKELEEQDND